MLLMINENIARNM